MNGESMHETSAELSQLGWKEKILAAFDNEGIGFEGRDGSTPILSVARDIIRLDPTSLTRLAAVRAITDIMNELSLSEDESRWKYIARLVRHAELREANFEDALARTFFAGQPSNVEERIEVFVALLDIGYQFTPQELKNETSIRDSFLGGWLDAWVQCDLFDEIRDEIPSLVNGADSYEGLFFFVLPNWFEILGRTRLLAAIAKWLPSLPDDAQSDIGDWAADSGITLITTVSSSSAEGDSTLMVDAGVTGTDYLKDVYSDLIGAASRRMKPVGSSQSADSFSGAASRCS